MSAPLLKVTVGPDMVTPEIEALMKKTAPETLAQIVRDPVVGLWKDTLKNFPRLPGEFQGFPDTGYGERAARSVFGVTEGSRISITAGGPRSDAPGLALRFFGGTIKPVEKKFLCFGVKPESYGKSFAEMAAQLGVPLKDGPKKKVAVRERNSAGKFVIVRREMTDEEGKSARRALRSMFGFAKQVTQRPNPAVVPSREQITEVAMSAIHRSLAA